MKCSNNELGTCPHDDLGKKTGILCGICGKFYCAECAKNHGCSDLDEYKFMCQICCKHEAICYCPICDAAICEQCKEHHICRILEE